MNELMKPPDPGQHLAVAPINLMDALPCTAVHIRAGSMTCNQIYIAHAGQHRTIWIVTSLTGGARGCASRHGV